MEVPTGFPPAVSGPDPELYQVLETVTRESFPDASFVPQVLGGFTVARFAAERPIP